MSVTQAKDKEGRRAGRGFAVAGLALAATAALSGCHVDMWRQPYIKPYYQSDFYADQQASRPLVQGTVPQGDLKTEDPNYYTGKGADGRALVKVIPVRAVQAFASPKAMLERGQDRYNAFCTPCHGKTGNGNGFITQRGLAYWQKLPASYHTDRLRKIEDGHIYDVITNGHGIMYGYATRIQDPNDRWAVVAYVRALQLMYEGQQPGAATGEAKPTTNGQETTGSGATTSERSTAQPGPAGGNGPGFGVPGPTGAPPRPGPAPPGPPANNGRPQSAPNAIPNAAPARGGATNIAAPATDPAVTGRPR